MKRFDLITLLTAALIVGALSAPAFQVAWRPPADFTPQGYVVFHGTQSGAYSDCWSAGNATNYILAGPLPAGANYFVVTAWTAAGGELLMSSWSNETVVTNTPVLVLNTVILTSTNLSTLNSQPVWLPWRTNTMVIRPALPAQFFKSGGSALTKTNIFTF